MSTLNRCEQSEIEVMAFGKIPMDLCLVLGEGLSKVVWKTSSYPMLQVSPLHIKDVVQRQVSIQLTFVLPQKLPEQG